MANTQSKLGFFQAVSTAAVSPIKGAASVGLMIGTFADHLWSRREYVEETVGNITDLVVLGSAAASRKAKKEMFGKISDISNVEQTLNDIETYWETK